MKMNRLAMWGMAGALAVSPVMVGCDDLPGGGREQGAVIGGLSGAAAGAILGGEDNRLVGALIGGALGAGGGYLIGQELDKKDKDEARQASQRAQENPVTVEDARRARTADINNDGFITLDEVAAMEQAGLSDNEMLDRLEETGQVFALNQEQEDYLRQRGVSNNVIIEMRNLNQSAARLSNQRYD